MALATDLLKKINQKYEPGTWISMRFRANDIALKTDEDGNAVQMFIGKMKEDGLIKGERYSRNLIRDKEGRIIKDHWDRKGKSS